MTLRARLWIVIAAVMLIPLLITVAAFVIMEHSDTRQFDRCLAALPRADLENRGAGPILDDLGRIDRYRNAKWNLNNPYQAGAYNILIPSGNATTWPAACELPKEPADCLASPRNQYVICNPAMGRQFASPLLNSGVASVEADAAKRFILLTFIGHELAHIAMSQSSRSRHFTFEDRENGLTCFQRPAGAPTEEERADALGTDIACQALVRRLSSENLPTDPADIQRMLSRLQDELDDGYFLKDDACIADVDYPSIGRRKHTFSLLFLKCLYPREWDPVEAVAQDDARSFDDLETWLRQRQRSGQKGSGSYGRATLFSDTILSLPVSKFYLRFDATGVDSTLWLVRPTRGGNIDPGALRNWPSTGRVLSSQEIAGGRRLWLTFEHGTDTDNRVLVAVDVKCFEEEQRCEALAGPEFQMPGEFLPQAGEDGNVVLASKRELERVTPGDRTELQRTLPVEHRIQLNSVDEAVVTTTGRESIVLPRQGNGLHDVSVLRDGTVHLRFLMMPPAEGESLEAVALNGGRLLLSSHIQPLVGRFALPMGLPRRSLGPFCGESP
jgi:hypothetical protein